MYFVTHASIVQQDWMHTNRLRHPVPQPQTRNGALIPRLKDLILTRIFPSDKIKDEYTRLVGSQELGRANLWGRPTARSAWHETSDSSEKPPGGESLGFAARSTAHLERDQSLVSFA